MLSYANRGSPIWGWEWVMEEGFEDEALFGIIVEGFITMIVNKH